MPQDSFWLLRRLRIAVMMAPIAAVGSTASANETKQAASQPTSQPTSMPTEEPDVTTEADSDGDGIPDMLDLCPEHAEVVDGVSDDDGCPDADSDGDSIPDLADMCPQTGGHVGMDGCPRPMRGRPMVTADGTVVLPATTSESPGAVPEGRFGALPAQLRREIAERWENDARLEYGSVASFARAALELMALGAPPDLVAGYHEAAIDEIRHAQRCFAHASEYAGREIRAGEMPVEGPRTLTLAQLAVHTFEEACVDETIATLCASRQAARCEYDDVRETLQMIVEDEARHAALAWQTVRWAIAQGGESVRSALRTSAAERRVAYDGASAVVADPSLYAATLRRHGRLSRVEEESAAKEGWHRVVEPMLNELLQA